MEYQVRTISVDSAVSLAQNKKSNLAVKIKAGSLTGQEESLHDPNGADKLELSKTSLQEELSLLKSVTNRKEASQAAIEDLHNSLLRMELVLYQAASMMAFDPDSLEAIQRRIVNELRGTAPLLEKVNLPEQALPNPDQISLTTPDDVAKLKEAISGAAEAVKKMKDQTAISENEKITGKALEIAKQNTEAAISTYDPQEIFRRAEAVAQVLKDQRDKAAQAHTQMDSQSVIDLVS